MKSYRFDKASFFIRSIDAHSREDEDVAKATALGARVCQDTLNFML